LTTNSLPGETPATFHLSCQQLTAGKDDIDYDKHPDVIKAILDKFGHEDPMPINLDVTNLNNCALTSE